ncbi:MAG: acylphosphatase [Deltaproteobacteria bacterium]|nr:acylphosphatase [Deltaproteobacteria bacterium]
MKDVVRAHIWVSGRVQGVFYRANTREIAAGHGLTGWVRNCFDGKVEAVLEGNRSRVRQVIDWCRKGPPSAHVTGIETVWEEATGEFHDFIIKY